MAEQQIKTEQSGNSQANEGYLNTLITERDNIDPSYVNALRFLEEEIKLVQSGRKRKEDMYLDVVNPRKTKVEARVAIPVKDFPKYNFVGKLLGPKGSTLQQLQESTMTRMSILGRGSMRDKEKEEGLRKEGTPKYAHLNKELHLLIEAYCPALEAYTRITNAIEEVQKYLVPDPNDDIRQGQLVDMGYGHAPPARGRGGPRGAGRGGRGAGPPMGRAPPPSRGPLRGRPVRGAGYAGAGRGAPPSRGLAYQTTQEEYLEESYDQQGYDDGYGDGYGAHTGGLAADDGGYGYERSAGDGYQSYDYGAGSGYGASSFAGGARLKAPAQKAGGARYLPYQRF